MYIAERAQQRKEERERNDESRGRDDKEGRRARGVPLDARLALTDVLRVLSTPAAPQWGPC